MAGIPIFFRRSCPKPSSSSDGAPRKLLSANVLVVDLSKLAVPVALEFAGVGAGSISDGIDTIVFQGIEEIILPRWIFAAMPPSLRACSDHGVRLSVAEHIAAPVKHIAAE